jgi:hypothetical protein
VHARFTPGVEIEPIGERALGTGVGGAVVAVELVA